jgi:hypothetical protein
MPLGLTDGGLQHRIPAIWLCSGGGLFGICDVDLTTFDGEAS